MEFKYFAVPPALRYVWFLAWRTVMQRVYEAHKSLVLWRESRGRGPGRGCLGCWPAPTAPCRLRGC